MAAINDTTVSTVGGKEYRYVTVFRVLLGCL